MTTDSYRPEIDGLRAIAVLSVIIFHFNPALMPGGFMGVDVFFVISGYLITGIIKKNIQNNQFKLIDFYTRRIRRIIPALYVLLTVVTIFAVIILLPGDLKDYGRSLLSQAVFASNFYFYFKSDYFDTPSLLKPILHTWSLSAEEQFYIIYPILLLALSRLLKVNVKYAILTLLVAGLITCHVTYLHNQSAAFYLLPSKSWELLLGALFNYNFFGDKTHGKPIKQTASLLGLFLILYAVFFFSKNTQLLGLSIAVPALGTALIIWSGGNTITAKLFTNRVFIYTGKISYSLYLWHWPLLVFYLYAVGSTVTLLTGLILFLTIYGFATLSYTYIENPIRKNPTKKTGIYFFAMFFGIVLFGATGYYFNKKEGLPNRFSAQIQNLILDAQPQIGCQLRLLFSKKSGFYYSNCGDTRLINKPALLVWGDSHSGMIGPVLKQLSNKYNKTFAIYSCPSALNVYIANWDQSYRASPCYDSNKEIINFIKSNNVKSILFASAWSQYTEGRELKMEGAGQKDKLYADSLTQNFSTADAKRVFRSKITYTVNLLCQLNVDIWIMKQVPQHQFWVPNEIAKRLIYKQDTTHIGRNIADHYRRQSFVNSVFEELAKKKNVHLLDPTQYFIIDKSFLTVYKNNKSLYYDYNHLSPYGAYILAPMFEPMFQSLNAKLSPVYTSNQQ
ncbi:MAG: acyltransferase family protein [Bacteroidota bacterium]